MSIENNKLMNLADGKVLYDDVRGRAEDIKAGIAPDYSELTFPVSAGKRCWHDGGLYTAAQDIAQSEAWTAAHWTATTIDNELLIASTDSVVPVFSVSDYQTFELNCNMTFAEVLAAISANKCTACIFNFLEGYICLSLYTSNLQQIQFNSTIGGTAELVESATAVTAIDIIYKLDNSIELKTNGFILENIIAKDYDRLSFPVTAGALCLKGSNLYKAIQNIQTKENWNQTHWQRTTIETELASKVSDIQVNGTSVVSGGVANVPIASNSNLGVVKPGGLGIDVRQSDGVIYISPATDANIKASDNNYRPIIPPKQHASTFYGLAKAAGDSTQSSSSNAVGNYTDEAKAAIQAMLGVNSMLAPVEADLTADAAYSIGQEFAYNGKLYKATSAIAIGDTITPGTNCTETKVSEEFAGKADKADTVLTTTLSRGRKANTTAGLYSFAFGQDVEASGSWSHAEGYQTKATSIADHAEGYNTVASGQRSHAEGTGTTSSGSHSHAEGNGTLASGNQSHAEGSNTTASGSNSHAEGDSSEASASGSHAEGRYSTASAQRAHAEGNHTTASGINAHSEGDYTYATGESSHAEGEQTQALSPRQHVQGYMNYPDSNGVYADIVGNGIEDIQQGTAVARNISALDWSGNLHLRGDVYTGANWDSTGGNKLATQGDVANLIDDTAGSGDTDKVWSADKSSALLSAINGKLDSPSTAGTQGQVLSLDSNLDPVWGDINPVETVSGTTPSITAKAGVRYICGEVATLTVVVPSSGIIDVTFDSGSTPTVLTVTPPTGMTMRWIGDDPTALEANKHYEINIMDGCNGMVVSWT